MTTRINPIAPRLKWDVLAPSELERIHEATLEIMEDVGIRFPSDKALTVLVAASFFVDGRFSPVLWSNTNTPEPSLLR